MELTATRRNCSKVCGNLVLVDGLGVGDVGNIVLQDRRQLSIRQNIDYCGYY